MLQKRLKNEIKIFCAFAYKIPQILSRIILQKKSRKLLILIIHKVKIIINNLNTLTSVILLKI